MSISNVKAIVKAYKTAKITNNSTKKDLENVKGKDTLNVPMKDYWARNNTRESTLSKLAKERDEYVLSGDMVKLKVDKLISDSEAYAKKLSAALKRARAISSSL